jgi:RNA polymerase sigma-70 factor, ECF subfamily
MRPTVPSVSSLDSDRLELHLARLGRAARRLCGSREAAEDLVQDTLERVLRSPRQVNGDEYAYLVRALRNTHIDRLRAAARRVRTTDMPETFEPRDRRAEDGPIAAREAREVLAAVDALPRPYRQAVLAIDVHGYTYQEASRVLQVPIGTLQSRAFRGRVRVARAVGETTALVPSRPKRAYAAAA